MSKFKIKIDNKYISKDNILILTDIEDNAALFSNNTANSIKLLFESNYDNIKIVEV